MITSAKIKYEQVLFKIYTIWGGKGVILHISDKDLDGLPTPKQTNYIFNVVTSL